MEASEWKEIRVLHAHLRFLRLSAAAVLLVPIISATVARENAEPARATSTPDTVPVATWLAGEGTKYTSPDSQADDSTGDGHDGLTAGAAWSAGDPADSRDADGEALTFDGMGSYVDVPTAVDLAFSRTISLEFDVSFSVNPAMGIEEILSKSAGGAATAAAYAVELSPAASS